MTYSITYLPFSDDPLLQIVRSDWRFIWFLAIKLLFCRYRESTQSFAALATQSASLSQSESALFDSDHPSPLGSARSEITFKYISAQQLRLEREKLGLEEWENDGGPLRRS